MESLIATGLIQSSVMWVSVDFGSGAVEMDFQQYHIISGLSFK